MTQLKSTDYAHRLLRNKIGALPNSSSDRNAFLVFLNYVAIKRHFQEDKVIWNLNATSFGRIDWHSFKKRKDQDIFYRLSKMSLEKCQNIIISAMLFDPDHSARDLIFPSQEMMEFHYARMRTVGKLNRTLHEDLDKLANHAIQCSLSVVDVLRIKNSQPAIIHIATDLNMAIETLCGLDIAFGFTRQKSDDPLWEINRRRIWKYSMFLNFDRKLLLKHIENIMEKTNVIRKSETQ